MWFQIVVHIFLICFLSTSFASSVSLQPVSSFRRRFIINGEMLAPQSKCELMLKAMSEAQGREISLEEAEKLLPSLFTLTGETLVPYYREMEFTHRKAGEFQLKQNSYNYKIKVNHDLMIMTTLVTEQMWGDLMLEPGWTHVQTDEFGRKASLNRNYPIQVTWNEAVYFANRLSEKMGLKPVYHLRKNKHGYEEFFFDETKKQNKIEEEEGFRLPTEDEILYALSDGSLPISSFENSEYEKSIWTDDQRHEVATKNSPHWSLYDLIGNGDHWLHETYGPYTRFLCNPQRPVAYRDVECGHAVMSWQKGIRTVHGDSYFISTKDGRTYLQEGRHSFRLVRTVK